MVPSLSLSLSSPPSLVCAQHLKILCLSLSWCVCVSVCVHVCVCVYVYLFVCVCVRACVLLSWGSSAHDFSGICHLFRQGRWSGATGGCYQTILSLLGVHEGSVLGSVQCVPSQSGEHCSLCALSGPYLPAGGPGEPLSLGICHQGLLPCSAGHCDRCRR